MKILKMQLQKNFSRSDVRISFFVFCAVPFAIAFMISMKSGVIDIGTSVFSAMGYTSVILGLLKSLLLIGGVTALIVTAIVSKEIDSGLDNIFLSRLKKRENLLISKMFTIDIFITLVFALLIVGCVLGWLVFLRDTEFGNKLFWEKDSENTRRIIFTVVRSYLEIIVYSKIFTLISIACKYSKAIILNLMILVVMRLLVNIEAIRNWIPTYIGNASDLFEYTGNKIVTHGVQGSLILLLYIIILIILSLYIYKMKDMAR